MNHDRIYGIFLYEMRTFYKELKKNVCCLYKLTAARTEQFILDGHFTARVNGQPINVIVYPRVGWCCYECSAEKGKKMILILNVKCQNVSKCFKMCQNVSNCVKMCQNVSNVTSQSSLTYLDSSKQCIVALIVNPNCITFRRTQCSDRWCRCTLGQVLRPSKLVHPSIEYRP